MAEPQNRIDAAVARLRGHSRSSAAGAGVAKDIATVIDALTVAQGRAVLAQPPLPPEASDHEQVSPVDGTTWVQRNDGWQHVDVLDREVRMRRSRFHGLMVGVDGHWAYVGDAGSAMRDYLTEQPTANVEPSWDERMRASRPVDLRDHAYEAWEEAEAARRSSAPDAADPTREGTSREADHG